MKKMSEARLSAIYCTHYINKVISCPGSNDVYHSSEKIVTSLDGTAHRLAAVVM
jgi:hypothetical protein